MMATTYKNSSPFNIGYIVQYQEGDLSLEKHQPTVVLSDHDDIRILKADETLHSIAYEVYGDSGKWYILAEVNNIMNPFVELKEGMKIRIPTYGIIEQ